MEFLIRGSINIYDAEMHQEAACLRRCAKPIAAVSRVLLSVLLLLAAVDVLSHGTCYLFTLPRILHVPHLEYAVYEASE